MQSFDQFTSLIRLFPQEILLWNYSDVVPLAFTKRLKNFT